MCSAAAPPSLFFFAASIVEQREENRNFRCILTPFSWLSSQVIITTIIMQEITFMVMVKARTTCIIRMITTI
jgi:hypothetical protein